MVEHPHLATRAWVLNNVLVCTSSGCRTQNTATNVDLTPFARLANNQTLTGVNTFRNTVAVQNTSGSANILVADAASGKVGIGLAPAGNGASLQVAGSVNATGGFSVNGVAGGSVVCGPTELLEQAVIQGRDRD
jgi:hypothetical protein